ncbi:unnamed protein product, partial [marine sediment metagenome]
MAQASEEELGLNLQDYLNIFLKRKWVILSGFLVALLSVFIYTNMQVPIYRTSLLFKIESDVIPPSEIIFPQAAMYLKSKLPDYTRELVSRPVLEQAARELGWIRDEMSVPQRERIVSNISGHVSPRELKKGNMIRLYATFGDPERAANIANKIFDVFKT